MKEFEKPGLTNGPPKTYSKYGDKIMPEGEKPNMSSDSQAKGPEQTEAEPTSAEEQAATRKAAEKMINDPKTSVEMRRVAEEFLKGNEKSQNNSQQSNQSSISENERKEITVTDDKAKELIDKFRRDHGESDFGKINQLIDHLSSRVRELTEERHAAGDTDGAFTSDGKETAATAAKFSEIDKKIEEMQTYNANLLASIGDKDLDKLGKEGELIKRTNVFVEGLKRRGFNTTQINDLENLTESEKVFRREIVSDMKKYLENEAKIDTGNFPRYILLAVRHFKELREELVSEILFKSFYDKSETNDYDVGLYASSNLDILLGFMNLDDKTRYRELFTLRTAARFFQTMNSTVIKGNFEHFGQAAENINYQHFENMRDIGGSGLAMRLYEQAYKDALADDKRILQDKIKGIHEFVERTFNEINDAGLINSQYALYRLPENSKMEEWEVQRALAAGRTFLNITLRNAESIATGRVPEDERRYASEPQEDMVRILNWNEWLLKKFTVGGDKAGRHGEEFLQMSTDRFHDFLEYKGAKLGINKITEFGGVNVRKMEDGGQYRTSGVFSGWRLQNMAFDRIYLRDENGNLIKDNRVIRPEEEDKFSTYEVIDKDGKKVKKAFMTVKGFKDQQEIKNKIKEIKDRIEKRKKANPDQDPVKLVTEDDQKEYRDILKPVVDQLDFGLSMLLKNGDFGAQDNKLGYLLREEIWKKIARTNAPIMIDYLTDIKYEWSGLYGKNGVEKKLEEVRAKSNKTPDDWLLEAQLKKEKEELLKKKAKAERDGLIEARSLEQIRNELGGVWKGENGDKNWENFKNKVLVNFERTIRKGMGEKLPPVDGKFELNADEKNMEEIIRKEGEKLAPHLADIVFAYTPFMNDMPFEKFNYDITGQTFYKRRTVSDLGGFNKGQQAFNEILDNPGGIPAKEALEAMGKIVNGVAGPEGPRAGMEANFPTFTALLDIVTTDPLKRQAMFKMLAETVKSETSTAQRWSGMKADSLTEADAAALVDDATRVGVLNPELARYLKKEKKLTFFTGILWMLLRDIIIFGLPIVATAEFASKVTKMKVG